MWFNSTIFASRLFLSFIFVQLGYFDALTNHRCSATAIQDTVGASHPTDDQSVAQQWPIRNLAVKAPNKRELAQENREKQVRTQQKKTTHFPVEMFSLQIFSILNADDTQGLVVEPQSPGDEEDIISQYPTLWTEQVRSRQNNRTRAQSSSCDQEQQSAQEEARQHKNEAVFVPDCAHGGLYKPVQCHPSTGYCWCVLVDTGRPIPGTSTRYEQPKCDGNARAHPTKPKDHYRSRHLQGCPGVKKTEFLTSVLDALSTDMVHAVTDPASAGRMAEPDPSHTLEERVVHWYFGQLDKNSSGDIGKKEIKPFKRFLRKKSKPKKCVKKFVEYCDISNDKALSLQELRGCLGVNKEEGAKTAESVPSSKLNPSKKQG
ncbi:SPARC-related modular calcium-binding protein 2 [Merluccius polli]|uniref:SPARC-related modular calcium-binding protein 2 n=1 Tax=Merluccius polli TaxID=89951 RepID=A0AA47NVU1_MERPO|nr:SPARC-related modular calcium-binding protein 2 [Merluccius polli]